MLPEPTLSFTLPSLHDGTILNCRVYHPWSLSPSPKAPPWHRHAAIVAHPYAPLGGNYDDGIVALVAATLLRAGFLVGTFNFRGAMGSAGRTSWTAKAERADYMSFAGFVSHYIHFLDPFLQDPSIPTSPTIDEHPSATLSSPAKTLGRQSAPATPPLLLLAGYSYGAMITSQLPSLETALEHFRSPKSGSSAAEIRLRAEHLAEVQNTVLGSARRAAERERRAVGGTSPRKSLGLRVGGDEDIRRKSHDSHHSLRKSIDDAEEKIRKGVLELLARTRSHHHHHYVGKKHGQSPALGDGDAGASEAAAEDKDTEQKPPGREEHCLPGLDTPPAPRVAYLLVSPPVGVAGNLASLSFSFPSLPKGLTRKLSLPAVAAADKGSDTGSPSVDGLAQNEVAPGLDDAEQKLVHNPTLLMYGDNDIFVSNRKMRDWAAKLQSHPGSLFRAHEVSTAGHFWAEGSADGEVINVLQHALRTFAEGLLAKVPG